MAILGAMGGNDRERKRPAGGDPSSPCRVQVGIIEEQHFHKRRYHHHFYHNFALKIDGREGIPEKTYLLLGIALMLHAYCDPGTSLTHLK